MKIGLDFSESAFPLELRRNATYNSSGMMKIHNVKQHKTGLRV